MNLLAYIEPDYKNSVTVTDATYTGIDVGSYAGNDFGIDSEFKTENTDSYIAEDYDYDDGFQWDHYKWSDTVTINIIKRITSNGATGDPAFLMHKYIDDEGNEALRETDSVRFVLSDDGYYTIDHIVLPVKDSEWYNKMIEQTTEEKRAHKIFYVDAGEVYSYDYIDGDQFQGNVVTLDYIISVGQKGVDNEGGSDVISMRSFQAFCVDHLRECYKKVAVDILNHCIDPCGEYYERKRFIRDFLWMTLNVINIYVDEDLYTEAQIVLEKSQSYNKSYPDNSYSTSSDQIYSSRRGGCSCRK